MLDTMMSMPSLPLLLYILIIYNMSNLSRDRFPPDAIFHKRSGLRDDGFSHAQRKAQFPPKNFIVFLYKLPNNFSCISTKITLYCNCSKKVLKNSTNAAKRSFTNWLSLFFPFFFTLFFFVIGSHLPITAKQARFYPSLFCFCLKFFWAPIFRQRLG